MRKCPDDGYDCYQPRCIEGCIRQNAPSQASAPHRTREELADILIRLGCNMGDARTDQLTLEEYEWIGEFLRKAKREPSSYKVTWLQHHHATHSTYESAMEHANILRQQGSQCTDIKMVGIYDQAER